ncbi:ankyrin repeat domain-containing protein 50 [Scleropages formosus]|uniref:Ankyrin repeat domain 63 n=1 Tax=Scleropages formosus TaxID=113540 RepID=A0A8C9V5U5_SCLFO|nr:ankyrin repeat domain-containing protein 63 [Scleropages formosus]
MLRPKDLCQGSGTKTFLDAMHNGKAHLARFVLDALDGRIINSKTENSRTPLMFAVCLPDPGARVKFTRMLLEKGANVNCQDDQGRTALSFTCELGYLDAVKLLVQYNADPEITDAWGNSALMYAAFAGHSQVLEFLVRAFKRLGLRLDRTNQAGHSAIQVADFFGHNQCVQALNVPGKKSLSLEDSSQGRELGGGVRRPNKLPKQVLEKFTKQFHSKFDDHLPALFQQQLQVGEGNGATRRLKAQQQSPEWKSQSQPFTSHLQQLHSSDAQDPIFTVKQIQNGKMKDTRSAKTMEHNPDLYKEDTIKEKTQDTVPSWGKAKSFNIDLLACRKQSYQGDMSEKSHAASKLKRGSLQDEKPLNVKIHFQKISNDSENCTAAPQALLSGMRQSAEAPSDSMRASMNEKLGPSVLGRKEFQKRFSVPQQGRPDKLLSQRAEMAPERLPGRAPGFTGLGMRLLRRFTAPEFMRLAMEFPSGSEHGRGRMSRSDTFPLSQGHQRVDSQPSVDSISAVQCEFDSSAPLWSKAHAGTPSLSTVGL